jgi:hypothetical protein
MPLLFHQYVAHALAAKQRPHLFYERAKFLGASLTCTWCWSTYSRTEQEKRMDRISDHTSYFGIAGNGPERNNPP